MTRALFSSPIARVALPALAALAALAALFAPRPAAAADPVDACAEASEQSQVLRDRGELRAARELIVKCASSECPSVIRVDCAEWLTAVDSKMPSIVVRAKDREGRDQVDVRVLFDGKEVAAKLDGRAIPVDPGQHTLRFEQPGSPPVEQSILVREGEKNRFVDVVLGAAAEPPPPPPVAEGGFRIPAASWVLAGGAVVGGAGFTYFGLRAKNDVNDMRSTCAPNCPEERVDAAKRDAIIANVSLGVGAAALGVAVVLVITGQPDSTPPAKKAGSSAPPRLTAGIAPSPGGGSLLLSGSF
jgi:hypothetical protein